LSFEIGKRIDSRRQSAPQITRPSAELVGCRRPASRNGIAQSATAQETTPSIPAIERSLIVAAQANASDLRTQTIGDNRGRVAHICHDETPPCQLDAARGSRALGKLRSLRKNRPYFVTAWLAVVSVPGRNDQNGKHLDGCHLELDAPVTNRTTRRPPHATRCPAAQSEERQRVHWRRSRLCAE
jgi:hypothetical protein